MHINQIMKYVYKHSSWSYERTKEIEAHGGIKNINEFYLYLGPVCCRCGPNIVANEPANKDRGTGSGNKVRHASEQGSVRGIHL
jgi:hypothetical protein